jgi:hypothetical protein
MTLSASPNAGSSAKNSAMPPKRDLRRGAGAVSTPSSKRSTIGGLGSVNEYTTGGRQKEKGRGKKERPGCGRSAGRRRVPHPTLLARAVS